MQSDTSAHRPRLIEDGLHQGGADARSTVLGEEGNVHHFDLADVAPDIEASRRNPVDFDDQELGGR